MANVMKKSRKELEWLRMLFRICRQLWKTARLSLDIGKWILDCYVKPILTYGSESWKISSQAKAKATSSRNVVLSKDAKNIMDTSRLHEEVLRTAETKWTLLDHKKEAAWVFWGKIWGRMGWSIYPDGECWWKEKYGNREKSLTKPK